jgi:hypothetical protein
MTGLSALGILLLTAAAATGRAAVPEPDTKNSGAVPAGAACTALAALDFTEATGFAVALDEVGILPAERDLPATCRITGIIEPQVGFEMRMPVKGWNGKLLVSGCTNLCGIIQVPLMEDALIRGYAAVTTDMGHRTGDMSDATWAYNDPALEADFSHRATHVTTVLARELVASYYGDQPEYAYFRGCSTGGRQALVSASRYPEDFDGIIAGAPFHQSLTVPTMEWAFLANQGPDGSPVLRKRDFELLAVGALKACDGLDGLEDGVIGDPESCTFRPADLACPADGSGGSCLRPAQVAAAEKIYGGPRNSRGQHLSRYPAGLPVGSEGTWGQQLLPGPGGQPAFFDFIVQNWSQYLAYVPDPPLGSGPFRFDFDRGPERLATTSAVAGFHPDLAAFQGRGGRLLLYHGWIDESILPASTLDYWQRLKETMGGRKVLDDFMRFYLVPGMQHCGGGPGATDVDWLTALERWVEKGEAPDALTAWKVRDNVPTFIRQPRFPLDPGKVQGARPLYPYPDVAVHDGKGNPADPGSWTRGRRQEPVP